MTDGESTWLWFDGEVEQAAISDHALIGDLRTAALIDRRGGIDWLCWPEFDRDPLFNQCLDLKGGRWDVSPSVPFTTKRRYLPGTNILETRFTAEGGEASLLDFVLMPSGHGGSVFVRVVASVSGSIPMAMRFAPTDGLSTQPARIELVGEGVELTTSKHNAVLSVTAPVQVRDGEARWGAELATGTRIVMALAANPVHHVAEPGTGGLERTRRWWASWIDEIELPTFATDLVERSALTLKLLASEDGGLVAAPTTSLPEVIGGDRNWDYRYSWLRDSSEAVLSLEGLAHA